MSLYSDAVALSIKYGKKYGIDKELIISIIGHETNDTYDPRSINKSDPSYGLMQVMIPTAKMKLGYDPTVEQLFNPDFNVDVGVWFLAYIRDKYGTARPEDLAYGYNAGPGNIRPGHTYVDHGYVRDVMSRYTLLRIVNDANKLMTILLPAAFLFVVDEFRGKT